MNFFGVFQARNILRFRNEARNGFEWQRQTCECCCWSATNSRISPSSAGL